MPNGTSQIPVNLDYKRVDETKPMDTLLREWVREEYTTRLLSGDTNAVGIALDYIAWAMLRSIGSNDIMQSPYLCGVDANNEQFNENLDNVLYWFNKYYYLHRKLFNLLKDNMPMPTSESGIDLAIIRTLDQWYEKQYFISPNESNFIPDYGQAIGEFPIDFSRTIVSVVNNSSDRRYYLSHTGSDTYTLPCDDCEGLYTTRYISGNTTYSASNYDVNVCGECYSNDYSYCSSCETDYHNSDSCRCYDDQDYNDDDSVQPEQRPQVGVATPQFNLRTIGIEFETGSGASNKDYQSEFRLKFPNWRIDYDGSLCDDGREFVSNPISGHIIQNNVIEFYELCKSFNVELQHQSAGQHIHVYCGDIYDLIGNHQQRVWHNGTAHDKVDKRTIIGSLVQSDEDVYYTFKGTTDENGNKVDRIEHIDLQDVPEETVLLMGNAFVNLARCFISINRMRNTYCSSPFGHRSKGSKPSVLKKTSNFSYPAIALRNLRTMEFRLFPSTSSVNYSLARIELAQKLTQYMYESLSKDSNYFGGITPENMPNVFRILNLSATVMHTDKVYPADLVDKLADMIGLSNQCKSSLNAIYKRNHFNKWNNQ